MENPFQVIMEKLDAIEAQIKEIQKRELFNKTETVTDEIMDIKKASAYIGRTKHTVYSYNRKREIPHYKAGRKVYYKKSDLDAWLTSNRISSKDEIANEVDTYINKRKLKWSHK